LEQFILQDSRGLIGSRISWWREGGSYTTNIDQAQIFTCEEAVAQHASRETDIPWPLVFVRARRELAVDFQYINIHWVPQAGTDLCYVAARFDFDGNDMYWVSPAGQTTDLTHASVYTLNEACARFGSEAAARTRHIWPKAYIDAQARYIASADAMKVSQALEATGIKLVQPARSRKKSPRCDGCGQFMAAYLAPGFCSECR
jgi:hypothetical protein